MPWRKRLVDEQEAEDFSRQHKRKARFLVDESLGVGAARVIREAGWNVVYVDDVGLSGHSDEDVIALAWRECRILLTHDQDFLDDRRFPPHRNPGLVVLPGADGGCQPILRSELARVLWTIGRHADAYLGYKIHVRDDGTWSIRSKASARGEARIMKFGCRGEIWEMEDDA